MTTPPARSRALAWLSTPSGIGTLFVIGLAIRLLLIGTDGFPTDMSAFKAWAGRLADRGPWNFYPTGSEDYFVDYPPGYLYVLWGMGLVAKAVNGGAIPDVWVKLPAIFADLGLAWFTMTGAYRLSPASVARRYPVRAMGAAAILLNPAIIFVSAVWGQADSVVALLVVASMVLIGTYSPSFRREAAGMALLAVAVGTKPQAGFVIPVVLLVLIWRHVRMRAAEADDLQVRRREIRIGLGRVAALGVAGAIAGFALFAPFRLFPARAYEFYRGASQTYRVTSVFGFNLWGTVGVWRPDSGPGAVEFAGIPVVWLGIALFAALGALVLFRAWMSLRHGVDQGRVLVFGSMAMTLVGFAVVTRIHERYLFLPLALGALLVSQAWLRRAFTALSVAYLVNVYFPYVYYLEREGLHPPKLGGLFDALYGPDINSTSMRTISLLITALCLAVVFLGWRALEATPEAAAAAYAVPGPVAGAVVEPREPVTAERVRWTLELHPIGRRAALIALGVFALAFASKVAGLGHPPGMYFDEVYHARTGAEYLGNKEVFEYTHPPLAKEVMGFAIHHLSGFRTSSGGAIGADVPPEGIVPHRGGVAVMHVTDVATTIEIGSVDDGCELGSTGELATTDLKGDRLASTPTGLLLAGTSPTGPRLIRFEQGTEEWRTVLPSRAVAITTVGERAFVVTQDKQLVTVSPEGEPDTLALGATALSASQDEVWVAFADERRIASWDAEQVRKGVIQLKGTPTAIVAPEDADRIYVAVGDQVLSYDSESRSLSDTIDGPATALGTIPETTSVWIVDGTEIRVLEPHSAIVIGRLEFDRAPDLLTADRGEHQLLGIADGRLDCASGRPQFAWRLGSALAGAAMVALVFLIAMRLFGNMLAGLLASLFLAVDGLAFTISRIAMNDSYTTAFILAAWFCALSALRARDRRRVAVLWLAACGVTAGLGLASKWVGLYAIAGIGLLFLWDGFIHRERSVWRIAGGFFPSVGVLVLLMGVVPIAIYVATYIPYFNLGHGAGDFFEMQKSMFDYHSKLTATHPFGSAWYGWPFGYRSVFLYLASGAGDARSEIWTIGNLVVSLGGLVAMVAAARYARRTKRAAVGIILLAALVQYVPWIAVSRVTFMYHYLPVVPWLAIALGWFLVIRLDGWKYRRAAIVAVAVSAVVVFVFLYPILVGWEMSNRYLELVRTVFPLAFGDLP